MANTSKQCVKRLQTIVGNYSAATSGTKKRSIVQLHCEKYFNRLKDYTNTPVAPNPAGKDVIYTNNYLNMEQVKVIGFDLDYTLVTYSVELQSFIYDSAKDLLVSAFNFPTSLKSSTFDPSFAIRGLSVDARHGVLIKLSQLQRVGQQYAYRGKNILSPADLESLYGASRHISHGDLHQLRPLHDMYSLAEGCLIADAIDHFEKRKEKYGELYSPHAVVDDVQGAIGKVHTSGLMHNAVMENLERFIVPNPKLPDLFNHMSKGGKKFLLCTNSGFTYTNKALSHVLKIPFKKTGSDWREIFDIVICSASKPSFYFDKSRFRLWNTEAGSPSTSPVATLKKGDVYINGSVHALIDATAWHGKDVLYLGDNLRADLQEARRWHGWHTGCIINEVEREVEIQNTDTFQELHFLRSCTRQFITEMQIILENEKRLGTDPLNSQDTYIIKSLQAELQLINYAMSGCFNKQFGGIFRTDGHPSLFALAVKRYADIYMKDVNSLLTYSPNHQFFPSQPYHMAHDPK